MFYLPDRCDAFPASQIAFKYMETLICDASGMTHGFCIPRDMNHPISDNFNNNTFYVMFAHTLLKISFLGYTPLSYRFPLLYGNTHLRWIADASQAAYNYVETSPQGDRHVFI